MAEGDDPNFDARKYWMAANNQSIKFIAIETALKKDKEFIKILLKKNKLSARELAIATSISEGRIYRLIKMMIKDGTPIQKTAKSFHGPRLYYIES